MDKDWCPYGKQPTDHYDLGVVTIPKTKPNLDIDLFRQYCDKIVVMQEVTLVFPRLLSRTTISIHRKFKKSKIGFGVIINLMLVITRD